MNDQLQKYARKTLKDDLAKCTEDQQLMFKKMYLHKNLQFSIPEVVDNMSDEKLDRAMQQVQRTLDINNEKNKTTCDCKVIKDGICVRFLKKVMTLSDREEKLWKRRKEHT